MKKIGLLISLLLLMVLAACGGAAVEQLPISDATDDPEAPAAVGDNAGATSEDTADVTESDPRQVRDRDWTKGATDPLITVIEYGDFQ